MSTYITPAEYEKLDDDDQFGYFAEYLKCRTVKERDYCDCCGSFKGWISRELSVGKPYRYRKAEGILEVSMAMVNRALCYEMNNSNSLMARLAPKEPKSDKITKK